MKLALVCIFFAPWLFAVGYILGKRRAETAYPSDEHIEALMRELRPHDES